MVWEFVVRYYYIFIALAILFICIIIDIAVDTKSKDKKNTENINKSDVFQKYEITEVDLETLKVKNKDKKNGDSEPDDKVNSK